MAINGFDIHAIVNRTLAPAEAGKEAVPPLAREAAAAVNRYLAENPQ